MSSIADLLKAQPAENKCRFSALMEKLDEFDLNAVVVAVKSGVSANIVAKAIRSGGHKISHSTIQEHRERRCMCKGAYEWQ